MKNKSTKAFTLIELLMVIAIIGILAGILIPTVGAVKKQANIAASKSQISQYVNAIEMFKGEYGYYPFTSGSSDSPYDLSSNSEDFIKTLSARNPSSSSKVTFGGNRRQISFHSFSETEFLEGSDTQLADRFGNTKIFIVVDADGNGQVTIKDKDGDSLTVKQKVSAYVEENETEGYPGYSLND
jgi:prepilin-type N-terminal cleavage/methylation domain